MFDEMYIPYDHEKAAFGKNWCGPDKYQHAKSSLVARYPKDFGGDGQSVDVFCSAAPARFYTLKIKAEPNSMGEYQAPFEVGTGSGMDSMAVEIAEAIASGLLAFYPASTKCTD